MSRIVVQFREPPQPTPQQSIHGAGHFSGFIGGALGYVRTHRIKECAVKVELLNGIMLHTVRVPSRGWVAEVANRVTGTVDLPPINSLVFVMFPYGMENLSGATVLYSVFDDANSKHAGRLVEGDERKSVSILEGGIKTTYDRETGNYLVEDLDDAKLKISVDKEGKKIELFDWSENKISLSSDGVKLEGKGNTVSLQTSKVLINGNLEILQ
jgi:hypothetical protein